MHFSDRRECSYCRAIDKIYDITNNVLKQVYSVKEFVFRRQKNDLQISQNIFACFLLEQPKRSHAPDLFEILGLTNLKDRSDLNILCLVFKCLNGLAPTYLSANFVRSQRNNNLRIPGASNNCGKRTFIYRASVLRNSLPDELKFLDFAEF